MVSIVHILTARSAQLDSTWKDCVRVLLSQYQFS